MLLELGRRFVEAGAIEAPDDVFWLERAEAEEGAGALDQGERPEDHSETVEALVAVDADEEINVHVARLARETFGIPNVIAVASSRQHYRTLRALGARWVQPSMSLLLALEGALEFPLAFDLLTRMRGIRVREATLRNAELAGQTLQELHLPGGALVMGIRREDEVIVPKGNTRLQIGDVLMLVASEKEFDQVHAWLEQAYAA